MDARRCVEINNEIWQHLFWFSASVVRGTVLPDVVIYRQSDDIWPLDDGDENFEVETGDFVAIFKNLKIPLF